MIKAYGVTSNTNFYDSKVQQKKKGVDTVKDSKNTEQVAKSSEDKLSSKAKAYLENLIKTYGDYDFIENIQILTPTKKGKLGTKELNKSLQNILNPKTDDINTAKTEDGKKPPISCIINCQLE